MRKQRGTAEPPARPPSTRPGMAPWAAAGVAGALLLVIAVALLGGDAVYRVLGYSDPGVVVRFGSTIARLTADVSAAIALGGLAFCAFFTSPQRSGGVTAEGYAALRWGTRGAWVWFAASAVLVPFQMSESSGLPPSSVLAPGDFLGLLHALYEPKAWVATALLALLVAVGAQRTLNWRPALGLGLAACLGLLPPVLVGHAGSNAGHDYATNAIVIHVVAAALWLGVLVMVARHLRRGGSGAELVLARYRKLALGCWLVLAASGLVNVLVLIPPEQLLGHGYGILVLLTLGLFLVLGAVGVLARRWASRSSAPGSALRLLGAELAIMLVTSGVSAGMTHVPPPNYVAQDVTPSEVILGYELPGAPSLLNFLTAWRFDLLLGTASVVLAALYLLGVRRLRRRGDAWPVGRTIAWLSGCATVVVATSSGLGVYSSGMFSVHMGVHMILNMLSPVLLVLGGPITLALRALPPSGRDQPHGPREWLLAAVHSPVSRILAHPAVATVLFVGSFYALYFTSLFEQAMSEHWAHQLMNVHFLVVGYLYYWTVIGVDPAPKPLPHLARLGMVFAVMPFHAFFGVIVMSMNEPIAENFFRTLNLPWAADLLADQNLAGGIAWAGGEAPLVLVLLALLTQWSRHDQREGKRADRSGDDELAAYNEMLAKLAQNRE